MYRQQARRDKRGFTLIELLVVIAIIAILAAILFPVFARARENARRTSCLSNLKQIGLGVMQYSQDYDERYPLVRWYTSGSGPSSAIIQTNASMPGAKYGVSDGSFGWDSSAAPEGGEHWVTWMDVIFPYLKSTQIFDCPSATVVTVPGRIVPSYGYSGAISGWYMNYFAFPRPSQRGGIALADIKRPSEVFMLLDYNRIYSIYVNPIDIRNAAKANRSHTVAHLEGGNVMFTDGHAKWLTRGRLASVPGGDNLSTEACNEASPNPNAAFCSKDWNPFID